MTGIARPISTVPARKHIHPLEFVDPQHYFESMVSINGANLRNLRRGFSALLKDLPSGKLAIATTGSDGRGENIGSKIDLTLLCGSAVQATCLKTLIRSAAQNGEFSALPLGLSNILESKYLHGAPLNSMYTFDQAKTTFPAANTMLGTNPRLYSMGMNTSPKDMREITSVRILDASLVYGSEAVLKQAQHLLVEQLISNPDALSSIIRNYKNQLADFRRTLLTGKSTFKKKELVHFEISDDNKLTSHYDQNCIRSVKYSVLRVLQYRLQYDLLLAIREEAKTRDPKAAGLIAKLQDKDAEALLPIWNELSALSYSHRLVDEIFGQEQGVVGRLSAIGTFGLSGASLETNTRLQDIYKLGLSIYHSAQIEHEAGNDRIVFAGTDGVNFRETFEFLAKACETPLILTFPK